MPDYVSMNRQTQIYITSSARHCSYTTHFTAFSTFKASLFIVRKSCQLNNVANWHIHIDAMKGSKGRKGAQVFFCICSRPTFYFLKPMITLLNNLQFRKRPTFYFTEKKGPRPPPHLSNGSPLMCETVGSKEGWISVLKPQDQTRQK